MKTNASSMAGLPRLPRSGRQQVLHSVHRALVNRADAIVEVTGNNVKMTRPIEDLVFDEK
jgi:hypothetical protein